MLHPREGQPFPCCRRKIYLHGNKKALFLSQEAWGEGGGVQEVVAFRGRVVYMLHTLRYLPGLPLPVVSSVPEM